MRVLIVAGLFYPSRLGGPANTLYWLARALLSKGLEVSVSSSNHFINDVGFESNKWVNLNGIRVCYSSKKTPVGFRQLTKTIGEFRRCDIIMLSSICYIPNLMVYFIARISNKRIIWSPRGEVFESAVKGNVRKKLYFKFINKLLTKKTIFHATSNQEEICIKKTFSNATNVVVIPNYFELPPYLQNTEEEKHYFIYVGRINPIKALDNLIRGLALSDFKYKDYQMRFVGPDQDNYREYLKELSEKLNIGEKVVFMDSLYGDEKYKQYANAYCCFLVSHSENFGNVVIEALSQGTPVIASTGTPWESLNTMKAGYWINNSPQSIANSINEILKLPKVDYNLMRYNARQLAESFDVYKNIDKWIRIFNDYL